MTTQNRGGSRQVSPRNWAVATLAGLASLQTEVVPLATATSALAEQAGEAGEAGIEMSQGLAACLTRFDYFEGTYRIAALTGAELLRSYVLTGFPWALRLCLGRQPGGAIRRLRGSARPDRRGAGGGRVAVAARHPGLDQGAADAGAHLARPLPPDREAVLEKVRRALLAHPLFQAVACPKGFSGMVLSRTEGGGEYGNHIDNALMTGGRADMSFKIFPLCQRFTKVARSVSRTGWKIGRLSSARVRRWSIPLTRCTGSSR
ncbi:hypothetical protein [Marimonas arenosa]|uniref:Uncharacterized protein n=1 Tax=Marimonas arenosa TaxID=1795305 RepID=A0AAE4B5X0_9RHOB|nr:hypothetical protein [Marimonas arenosa]MDQ2091612.1 hypothetical protein [Marimonas arenosa]